MSILRSSSDIFCTATGSGLEPVRAGHFLASFVSYSGSSLSGTSDYHLRRIEGLGQSVTPGSWQAINYQIPFPELLSAAAVTLSYMLLTNQGGDKKTLLFWQRWRDKVYDFDHDMPALFNECAGSGSVRIMKPGPNPSEFAEFQLDGIWPTNVEITGFDRDSIEPMSFVVSLSVAQIRPR